MIAPPRDEAELLARAKALRGRPVEPPGVHGKGKLGEIVERSLGATGGSAATWDFPHLKVELKTIPIDGMTGVPRESTFVCAVRLEEADRAEWASSWVRSKLSRVLWVPVRVHAAGHRTIGEPLLWSPSAEEEAGLAADFDEILGRIGRGDIESVTAHLGRWLQMRPKAAHGRIRTTVRGDDGAIVSTVPRGFYLRTRFTRAILGAR